MYVAPQQNSQQMWGEEETQRRDKLECCGTCLVRLFAWDGQMIALRISQLVGLAVCSSAENMDAGCETAGESLVRSVMLC